MAVDDLDNPWREQVVSSTVVIGRITIDDLPVVLGAEDGFSVTAELYDMTGNQLMNPNAIGMPARSPGFADMAPAMQQGSPKPGCPALLDNAFWNEDAGSTVSRNAVLFRFSEPVSAFGAWFGDLETRNDGYGVPALVRLFEPGMREYGDANVITSTVDQSVCGSGSSPGAVGCGNRTTRWIGFVADASELEVTAMLVVVGDDDRYSPNNATGEHISFIGPTVARARAIVSDPELPSDPESPSVSWSARVYLPVVRRNSRTGPRTVVGECD